MPSAKIEDIDRSSIKLSLFDDGGIDVVAQDSAIAAEGSCTDVPVIAGVSFKFGHDLDSIKNLFSCSVSCFPVSQHRSRSVELPYGQSRRHAGWR